MPALILLPTNCLGFSTKRSTRPELSSKTTTPYLEGSVTLVTRMVASPPCRLWYSRASRKGYSQMTSALSMKKGSPLPSSSSLRAMASGPAVPMGSGSSEHVILMPSFASYSLRKFIITLGWYAMAKITWSTPARFSASIWCRIIGLFAKSTSGLGTDRVRGRSRVPNPPTKIMAFIVARSLLLVGLVWSGFSVSLAPFESLA
mmetsp:Transcript_14178/g.36563  ORF Transcript_14178/g.36563 Transcript_14178/m.36563 type:complete len:203 (+) Transcript_14178:832-1440(+)